MSSFVERLIGRLPMRELRPPDDGHKRAAVAAIVHDAAAGPHVLLMKRIDRDGDPWSGQISLPGGGYQRSDGDLLATAIRETIEEVGVALARAQLVGPLAPMAPFSAGREIEITPFAFAVQDAPPVTPGPEAVSAFWLPLDRAASGELDTTYVHPGIDHTFPAWRYEGHTIWGLTWRILGILLEAAR